MPNLRSVNNSIGFYANYVNEFDGVPLLNSVGGSLVLADDYYMTKVTLPVLQYVGGLFAIYNNPRLAKIDELFSLRRVGGGMELTGNFTE